MSSALAQTPFPNDAHAAVRQSLDALAANDVALALAAAETALRSHPEFPPACHAVGLAALRLGRLANAIQLFERAHAADPATFEHAEALAIGYAAAGRLVDSLYYGKLATALTPSAEFSDLLPPWVGTFADHFRLIQDDPLVSRGNALLAAGQADAARELFRQEIELDRHSAAGWRGLAAASLAAGRPADAVVASQALCEVEPERAVNLAALGCALSAAGRHAEAHASYREAKALGSEPDIDASAIAALVADPATPRATLAAELGTVAAHRPPCPRRPTAPTSPVGRPLRVGFLSARFRAGAGLDLFLPIIESRDRAAWHVFLYDCGAGDDALGRRLRNAAASVTELAEVDDDTAALLIGNDAIDVLIDLDLHEPGWRWGIVAQRPAAAMLGWLGLEETGSALGYDAMLGDRWTHGDGTDVVAMPDGVFCVPGDAIVAGDAARPQAERAIFATLATPAQVTADAVGVWGKILAAVPNASLHLDPLRLYGVAEQIREQLATQGLGAQVLLEPEPVADVVLDPPGAAVCPELVLAALRSGAPVVTLPGDIPARRRVASMLRALGLDDLVAADREDYVRRAVRLAEPQARAAAVAEIAARPSGERLTPAARAAALHDALRRFLAGRPG
ncbi:MAG TPA: hypothetical protein VFA12_18465 [Stellaceae bacterium]|nr:hypothetical protein [Stellaceae bacterium]